MKNRGYWTGVFLAVIVLIGLDFLLAAGILKVICWCFSLTFQWKYALGIWLILVLLQGTFTRKSR